MSDKERSCLRACPSAPVRVETAPKPNGLGPGFWHDPIERTYGSAKPPASQPIRPPSRTCQAMPMGSIGRSEAARPPAGHRSIKESLLMADADDKKPQGGHS